MTAVSGSHLGVQALEQRLHKPGRLVRLAWFTVARAIQRLRLQPPSNERERLRRDSIKPLRVIDEADQRRLLRHLGKKAPRSCQPDEGADLCRSPDLRPTPSQRIVLEDPAAGRAGPAAARTVVEPGEREAPSPTQRPPPAEPELRTLPARQVLQKCGLPDPRLAAHNQHPT